MLVILGVSYAKDIKHPDTLVGYWYGELDLEPITKKSSIQKYLALHNKDGEFEILFKVYDKNTKKLLSHHKEYGSWWVDDDKLVTKISKTVKDGKTKSPNTPEGYYLDKYQIIELTDKKLTYRHIQEKLTFTINKVAADYKF
jgi:hypothetical protein